MIHSRRLFAAGCVVALGCQSAPPSTPVAPPCPTTAQAPDAPSASSAMPVSEAPTPMSDEDAVKVAELAARPSPMSETTPRFSPDGKRLAYLSNADGALALYVKDIGADGPPRKVGAWTGAYRRPVFSPDGAHIYFTADTKGDEAYLIKRVALADGKIEEVASDGTLRRDGPWFSSGDRWLFGGRGLKEAGTVIFELGPPRGSAPTKVFEDPGTWLAAVRPDGKEIALLAAPRSDAVLAAAPGEKAAARRIYPPDERARRPSIHAVAYAPDGKRMFVATDDGTEHMHILALDGDGRMVKRRSEGAGGDIHGLVTAKDRLAYVFDRGTHHEIRVLDATTLEPLPPPRLPTGSEVVAGRHPTKTPSVALSPDGSRLALQWSSPASPPRIHLVDTRTGATAPLSPVTTTDRRASDVEITRVRSFDDLEVPVIVYGARAAAGKRAVVMSIHGGFPFAATVRHDPILEALLDAGYIVVEPNVRGSGGFGPAYERADNGAKKLDGVRDFRAVGEWIAAQPWADARRMAVMGGSAGGYYTLMCLAHQPELWRAGLAFVPVYDVQAQMKSGLGDLSKFMTVEMAPLSEPGVLAAISPSTYVHRIRAPLFLYAGARDVRTPVTQLDGLVRSLRGRKQRVEYMLSDYGHARTDPRVTAEQTVRMLRFLREELPDVAAGG